MTPTSLYVLDGHTPVRCDDVLVWGAWYETADRIVARTEMDGVVVSTVFLGLDHNFRAAGPPILFETMVWFDGDDVEQVRYETWDDALAGHAARVVAWQARLEGNRPS